MEPTIRCQVARIVCAENADCPCDGGCYTAADRIIALVEAGGWISCAERMPTEADGYHVQVWNGTRVRVLHWDHNKHAKKPTPRWADMNGLYHGDPIMCWKPLSAPPA